MKLTDIHTNERNPRTITKSKLSKLKKSISEFSKMMALRPIVVNADGMILGGNQRYHALVALGYKEIPDEWVKRADDLTPEEQRRFIIEDNLPFGAWDFDMLASDFEFEELTNWGFEAEELLGFDAGGDEPKDAEPQMDKAEELRVAWGVETGQLWRLPAREVKCPKCGKVHKFNG